MLRPRRSIPEHADRRPARRPPCPPSRRHAIPLDLEWLEPRRLLTVIPVTTTVRRPLVAEFAPLGDQRLDNHPSSSPSSPNVIVFEIQGTADFQLTQPLPAITQPLIIDGYSAAARSIPRRPPIMRRSWSGSMARGSTRRSTPAPKASGSRPTTAPCDGLSITGFSGSGIDIEPPSVPSPPTGSIGTTIWGNWIGVAPDGSAAPNPGAGVIVACSNNVIGGTLPYGRNLIENSGDAGVILCGPVGAGNLVQGSFILDNGGDGVLALSPDNVIGQPIGTWSTGAATPWAGNVISGNGSNGVYILDPASQGNIVSNNLIGPTPDGLGGSPTRVTASGSRTRREPGGRDRDGQHERHRRQPRRWRPDPEFPRRPAPGDPPGRADHPPGRGNLAQHPTHGHRRDGQSGPGQPHRLQHRHHVKHPGAAAQPRRSFHRLVEQHGRRHGHRGPQHHHRQRPRRNRDLGRQLAPANNSIRSRCCPTATRRTT